MGVGILTPLCSTLVKYVAPRLQFSNQSTALAGQGAGHSIFTAFVTAASKILNRASAADRARNRLVDGLSAPSHYAAAFSSPSRTFAGRVFFHTAAANFSTFPVTFNQQQRLRYRG